MAFAQHGLLKPQPKALGALRARSAAPRPAVVAAAAASEGDARRPRLINVPTEASSGPETSTTLPGGPLLSRRTLVVPPALATAGLATCACCPKPAKAWGYEGLGAAAWGGVCATGAAQSPIDLPLSELATDTISSTGGGANKFGDITFKYRPSEQTMVMNTGHGTMQVIFPPGNIASVGGVDMELLQFHFHTPSEHAMDGMRSPMEVHLVHKVQSTGSLAVVGVMIEGGAASSHPAIQTAFEYAPALWRTRGNRAQVLAGRPLNAASLLPDPVEGRRAYVHYAGSLTTPPCSEGVDWFVMTKPILATDEQILDFMHYVGKGLSYGFNSRPIQPINRRYMEYELCTNWAKA